jgi:hypothetical protein
MTQYLYKRVLPCELESPSGEKKTFEHNVDQGKLFRIDFNVEFKGTASISLYNVLDETVQMVKPNKQNKKNANLKLFAGYDEDMNLLASGEIIQSLEKWNGRDNILKLKIAPKTDRFLLYVEDGLI